MISVRGRASKATDGRRLDLGPISIPTEAERMNRFSWSWAMLVVVMVVGGSWISAKNRNRRLRSGVLRPPWNFTLNVRATSGGRESWLYRGPGFEATDFERTPYTTGVGGVRVWGGLCERSWCVEWQWTRGWRRVYGPWRRIESEWRHTEAREWVNNRSCGPRRRCRHPTIHRWTSAARM